MKIEEMIASNRADCSGCEACANICPKNAISMIRDAEGFAYPKIDPALCIQCGKCDATCPALNFTKKTATELPPTFAAIYNNKKILRHSSSGGIFSALSEIVLKNGGVVFGAGFDKDWRVFHTSARNEDELENLRGSKYVQSRIGDVYRQVKEALKSTSVLFSGVPCQCAGLKHFLGKDYDNLLTVEIICHAVGSPALWENYIDEIGYSHEISNIKFRSKRNGWSSKIYMDINFFDQGHIISHVVNNLYGRFFLRNLSLRPSCSSCKFRFPNGQSDLSLGDAWGIQDFARKMLDNRGVSVVFIHTAKGKEFFDKADLKVQQVNFTDAINKNKLFISPTVCDSRRETFFADLANSEDWFSVMKKYYDKDDREFTKERSDKQRDLYEENLQEILSSVRRQFEQNVLVVASVRNNEEQKLLSDFFDKNFKNCGVYLLQPKDEGQLVCTEKFSGIKFDLKDAAELTDFVKNYNLTEIFVEKPLDDFGESMSLIIDWLNDCGLPVKDFSAKTD